MHVLSQPSVLWWVVPLVCVIAAFAVAYMHRLNRAMDTFRPFLGTYRGDFRDPHLSDSDVKPEGVGLDGGLPKLARAVLDIGESFVHVTISVRSTERATPSYTVWRRYRIAGITRMDSAIAGHVLGLDWADHFTVHGFQVDDVMFMLVHDLTNGKTSEAYVLTNETELPNGTERFVRAVKAGEQPYPEPEYIGDKSCVIAR